MMASKSAVEHCIDIATRQLARFAANAGVDVQCATTALSGGHHDLATIFLKHAHRGFVQPGE